MSLTSYWGQQRMSLTSYPGLTEELTTHFRLPIADCVAPLMRRFGLSCWCRGHYWFLFHIYKKKWNYVSVQRHIIYQYYYSPRRCKGSPTLAYVLLFWFTVHHEHVVYLGRWMSKWLSGQILVPAIYNDIEYRIWFIEISALLCIVSQLKLQNIIPTNDK